MVYSFDKKRTLNLFFLLISVIFYFLNLKNKASYLTQNYEFKSGSCHRLLEC